MIFPLIWLKNIFTLRYGLMLPWIQLDPRLRPRSSTEKPMWRTTFGRGSAVVSHWKTVFFFCFPLSYRRVAWNCRHGILWTFLWPQITSMKEPMAFSCRPGAQNIHLRNLGHQFLRNLHDRLCANSWKPVPQRNVARQDEHQGENAESQGPKVLQSQHSAESCGFCEKLTHGSARHHADMEFIHALKRRGDCGVEFGSGWQRVPHGIVTIKWPGLTYTVLSSREPHDDT